MGRKKTHHELRTLASEYRCLSPVQIFETIGLGQMCFYQWEIRAIKPQSFLISRSEIQLTDSLLNHETTLFHHLHPGLGDGPMHHALALDRANPQGTVGATRRDLGLEGGPRAVAD